MGHVGKALAALLLGLFLMAGRSVGCTVVYPTVSVGPNFQVRVADRGRPVQGLQVALYGKSAKLRAVSDKTGTVVFRNVPPGAYNLSADHDAGFSDGAEIEVHRAESSEVTVPLRWPNHPSMVAASLKGSLHLPDSLPGQPQPSISMELLEAISGRTLMSAKTDRDGAFDFPGVGRGLYFLSLKPVGGLMAMAVEPNAPDLFDIDLGETSCGLQYINQRECPLTNLHLTQIGGHVFDESGGAFADAEVLLLDVGGRLVQQERTDRAGNFALSRPAGGMYQLFVRETGFTPLRGSITVAADGASSPVAIQLGILGRCSHTSIP